MSTDELVNSLVIIRSNLKTKHFASAMCDGASKEEIDDYRETFAALTRVIIFIRSQEKK